MDEIHWLIIIHSQCLFHSDRLRQWQQKLQGEESRVWNSCIIDVSSVCYCATSRQSHYSCSHPVKKNIHTRSPTTHTHTHTVEWPLLISKTLLWCPLWVHLKNTLMHKHMISMFAYVPEQIRVCLQTHKAVAHRICHLPFIMACVNVISCSVVTRWRSLGFFFLSRSHSLWFVKMECILFSIHSQIWTLISFTKNIIQWYIYTNMYCKMC